MTSMKTIVKLILLGLVVLGCDNVTVDADGLHGRDSETATGSDTTVGTGNTNPVDTVTTNPIDTVTTNPIDTVTTNPIDTATSVATELEAGNTGWEDVTAMTGCGCDEDGEVCGVNGTCVPRCDEIGRCVEAVVEREVKNMTLVDDDLYMVQSPQQDALENPLSGQRLVQVNLATNTSTEVFASEVGTEIKFVGMTDTGSSGALAVVALKGDSVKVITISSTLQASTPVVLPSGVDWDSLSLVGDYLYYFTNESDDAWRILLDASATPEVAIAASAMTVTLPGGVCYGDTSGFGSQLVASTDVVWYTANCTLCALDVSANDTLHCGYYEASYNWLFPAEEYIWSISYMPAAFGQRFDKSLASLNVYAFPSEEVYYHAINHTILYRNWGYLVEPDTQWIVGFPLAVAREPQRLLPSSVFTEPYDAYSGKPAVVGQPGLVWVHEVKDATGKTIRTLVFSVPLPPRMCDAELPCDAGETCGTDGFCATP